MTEFFTADTHFGHANVLGHDGRPFATIEEHDESLISRWNSRVSLSDTVYHLGDFAWKKPAEYRARLNGRIILIEGNHDRHFKRAELTAIFGQIHDYLLLKVNRRRYTLCHYSMRSWYNMWRGGLHLHGHSHGQLPRLPGSLDVGVNMHNYQPLALDEVLALIGDFQGASHHM